MMKKLQSESLLSAVLSSGGSWGASWKVVRMIKDSPTGERGRIEDFHLIAHTNTGLPPPLPLLPVMNHTSFCVSRGHNGERPGPLL